MHQKPFPVIDMVETGRNIMRLREERGMTVRDLQAYFGFEEPQAIYKWQRGKSLPTVDNLYALGALLDVPMEDILVPANAQSNIFMLEQQEEPCCSNHFWTGCFGHGRNRRTLQPFLLMQCALGFFRRRLPPLTASDRLPEGIFLTCM